MKIDLTTKLLLGALTLGVWGLLLKPVVTPVHATAAAEPTPIVPAPALALGNDGIYVAAPAGQLGNVYRFSGKLGQPALVGSYGQGR